MEQACPKCGTANLNTSRYCKDCGMTLGATIVQGRTVVLPPQAPAQQTQPSRGGTVLQWARNTFGAGGSPVCSSLTYPETNAQRELTIFVEDISGSMGSKYDNRLTKLQAAQRAAASMVLEKARLDAQDEIGLVSFNGRASAVLPLCPIASHRRQIIEAIQSLSHGGGTDINEGLKAARDMFDWRRQGVVRRIVLLTDGHGGDPLHTADDLKGRGVVIDVRGVGDTPNNVDEKLLREVASVIEGEVRYRFIKDSQTLVNDYTQLANKTKVNA